VAAGCHFSFTVNGAWTWNDHFPKAALDSWASNAPFPRSTIGKGGNIMPLSYLAQSIRWARRSAGLTQEQLGLRLGLKGRAIFRWERDQVVPSKKHREALVTALRAVNDEVATRLEQAIAVDGGERIAAAPAPPPIDEVAILESAVFTMADELDLPPRRVRHALRGLVKRLRADKMTIDATEKRLEEWIATSAA
jgi:transcriptional regulator with XRE-family HTH domain